MIGAAHTVCLDMAGTTVSDGGAVMEAFRAGFAAGGLGPADPRLDGALAYARDTMGQSKIDVFRSVLGDGERAEAALAGFEHRWEKDLAGGRITELPGARDTIDRLRGEGIAVALLTGFPRPVRDALLEALGWWEVADLTVCPEDAGRGRPWPDMVLWAALQLRVPAMSSVVVVGDTPSDVESAVRSGAGGAVGVLTGTGTDKELRAAGATHILASVADLPTLLLPPA